MYKIVEKRSIVCKKIIFLQKINLLTRYDFQ